ncbi:MAG: 3-hydroxyacyl-CoA dehydrogenase family protein [Candidatus Bathyarchaeia archaeon]
MVGERKVTCVGVGLIGHSWATLFAWKGCSVTLYDVNRAQLENALERIRNNLLLLAKHDILKDDVNEVLKRIEVKGDLSAAVAEADYIQESVVESYEVKKHVFREISESCKPEAIIASSTSSLRMTEIQKAAINPGRCVIAHPWNPPHLMPLVEIIPGEATRREVVELTRKFMVFLGKVAVVQKKETVGSIGNRLAAALWREAINLVNEGVADPEEIDKAVSAGPGLRWSIVGPFLSYYLGGGKGGIKYFLSHLGGAMESRWKTLAKWTELSEEMREKIIRGMKSYSMLNEKTYEDMVRWRDEKIIQVLKILYGDVNC